LLGLLSFWFPISGVILIVLLFLLEGGKGSNGGVVNGIIPLIQVQPKGLPGGTISTLFKEHFANRFVIPVDHEQIAKNIKFVSHAVALLEPR
jgi:hypothetical protein